jgi:peroxiredoxin
LLIGLNRQVRYLLCVAVTLLVMAQPGGCETLSRLLEAARITPLNRPKQSPNLSLPDIRGNLFRLKDLEGRIVLLNFWAIWCGPCLEEMPSFERLHRHFGGKQLTIVAVSLDLADTGFVRNFVDKHRYSFTVLHDPRRTMIKELGGRRIPVTYVIDPSGRIIGKAVGPRDWADKPMIRLFEELLKPATKGYDHESGR